MANNVVALFDTREEVRGVRDELIGAGFNDQTIRIIGRPPGDARLSTTPAPEQSFWEGVKDFFGFGYDDDRKQYEEGVRRGGTFIAVSAPDDRIDRAVDIMMSHHPVDLERRAAEWRTQGWTGHAATAPPVASSQPGAPRASAQQAGTAAARQGEQAIPVVQEEIQIGKRQVQQRGVRIYQHVTERPVEKEVQLRDERVTVERRPVNRPVADANRAFQEQAFEVIETREEPVVTKQARVVEEVVVNRDVNQRSQTVRDTVRHTDVDVQQTGATAGDDDFRRLYDSDFASRGMSYEQLRPGFEYGRRLATDQRYRGRDWNTIESDARTAYERANPGGTWERLKDSVRAAYDRARSKV